MQDRSPDRVRAMPTVRDASVRPLPRPRDDDDVRQPRLDRAADARRLPRRLPLRARPAGGGRGRHGRRLRPGLGQDDGGQPPHRARRRQRDGGDLQRPGQPLAAADHRRPAGAGADHPAGEPDQPRRDADAAPAGQVVLRAAAGRGRAAGARPRRPPRRPAADAAPSSSRCRWTTGTSRSTRPTPRRRSTARSPAAPAPTRTRSRALAAALDAATNPVLVAGPDIDASGAWDLGDRPRRAPAPAGLGLARRPAAAASASPRTTRTSAACCRRRSARSARRSRATT